MNIIRELRKRANLQQKELAAEVGVSVATVSDWETQKKDPFGDRLRKLAQIFNVDELVILGALSPSAKIEDDDDTSGCLGFESLMVYQKPLQINGLQGSLVVHNHGESCKITGG